MKILSVVIEFKPSIKDRMIEISRDLVSSGKVLEATVFENTVTLKSKDDVMSIAYEITEDPGLNP
jgi:hypothetical protein